MGSLVRGYLVDVVVVCLFCFLLLSLFSRIPSHILALLFLNICSYIELILLVSYRQLQMFYLQTILINYR